jgi:hypothetical protein
MLYIIFKALLAVGAVWWVVSLTHENEEEEESVLDRIYTPEFYTRELKCLCPEYGGEQDKRCCRNRPCPIHGEGFMGGSP